MHFWVACIFGSVGGGVLSTRVLSGRTKHPHLQRPIFGRYPHLQRPKVQKSKNPNCPRERLLGGVPGRFGVCRWGCFVRPDILRISARELRQARAGQLRPARDSAGERPACQSAAPQGKAPQLSPGQASPLPRSPLPLQRNPTQRSQVQPSTPRIPPQAKAVRHR